MWFIIYISTTTFFIVPTFLNIFIGSLHEIDNQSTEFDQSVQKGAGVYVIIVTHFGFVGCLSKTTQVFTQANYV